MACFLASWEPLGRSLIIDQGAVAGVRTPSASSSSWEATRCVIPVSDTTK